MVRVALVVALHCHTRTMAAGHFGRRVLESGALMPPRTCATLAITSRLMAGSLPFQHGPHADLGNAHARGEKSGDTVTREDRFAHLRDCRTPPPWISIGKTTFAPLQQVYTTGSVPLNLNLSAKFDISVLGKSPPVAIARITPRIPCAESDILDLPGNPTIYW